MPTIYIGENTTGSPTTITGKTTTAYLNSDNPVVYTTGSALAIKDQGAEQRHTLVKFDLVGLIPAGQVITDAKLHMRIYGGAENSVNVRRMLQAWTPAQASYANYDHANTLAWAGSGATGVDTDRVEAPVATHLSTVYISEEYRAYSGLATVIQYFYDTPSNNHGLHLQMVSGGSLVYRDINYANDAAPYLEVSYAAAGAVPTITGLTDPIRPGLTVTLTGTNFESPQNSGTITQDGQPVSSVVWSDNSITFDGLDVEASTSRYASHEVYMTNHTGDTIGQYVSALPVLGYGYTNLAGTLATSGDRITTAGSLTAGDQIVYQNKLWQGGGETSYPVTVNADGSFTVSGSPGDGTYTFTAKAWDSASPSWGTEGIQTVVITGAGSGPAVSALSTTAIARTTATIRATTDSALGTLYYVLNTSATPLTVATIKASPTGSKTPTVGTNTFDVTGLSEGVTYYAHFAQNDGTDDSTEAVSSGFTVVAEPNLSSPGSSSVAETTVTVAVTSDSANGTMYCLVNTSASTPTPSAVKSGATDSGAAVAGSNPFDITGLTGSQSYYAHFAQEDSFGFSPAVTTAQFTMTDPAPSAPTLTNAVVRNKTTTTATIACDTDDASGTLYYFVSTDPGPHTVSEIQNGNGAGPVDDGSNASLSVGEISFNLTGLSVDTPYYSFFVQDDGANDSEILVSNPWSLYTPSAGDKFAETRATVSELTKPLTQ